MSAEDDPLAELLAQERELQLTSFTNDDAWALGLALVEAARAQALAVTVDVRRGDHQLFHYALPGTAPDNDVWIERKTRVVRRFEHSSYYLSVLHRQAGTTLAEKHFLDPDRYAAHGGCFPVIVRGVGVVGTVTVSGLPQADDHALVVSVLRAHLAGGAPRQPRAGSGGAATPAAVA
jgi:uncharacterized protein (UPF0303 family)